MTTSLNKRTLQRQRSKARKAAAKLKRGLGEPVQLSPPLATSTRIKEQGKRRKKDGHPSTSTEATNSEKQKSEPGPADKKDSHPSTSTEATTSSSKKEETKPPLPKGPEPGLATKPPLPMVAHHELASTFNLGASFVFGAPAASRPGTRNQARAPGGFLTKPPAAAATTTATRSPAAPLKAPPRRRLFRQATQATLRPRTTTRTPAATRAPATARVPAAAAAAATQAVATTSTAATAGPSTAAAAAPRPRPPVCTLTYHSEEPWWLYEPASTLTPSTTDPLPDLPNATTVWTKIQLDRNGPSAATWGSYWPLHPRVTVIGDAIGLDQVPRNTFKQTGVSVLSLNKGRWFDIKKLMENFILPTHPDIQNTNLFIVTMGHEDLRIMGLKTTEKDFLYCLNLLGDTLRDALYLLRRRLPEVAIRILLPHPHYHTISATRMQRAHQRALDMVIQVNKTTRGKEKIVLLNFSAQEWIYHPRTHLTLTADGGQAMAAQLRYMVNCFVQ